MADQKIMATNSESQPNTTKAVTTETSTPVVPGDFHEFSGSQAKMYDTYKNRQETIAEKLGTKAPLVS